MSIPYDAIGARHDRSKLASVHRAYRRGDLPPNHPVPSVIAGAKIQSYIVDIVTPKQSKYPPEASPYRWVCYDNDGWIWSVYHWALL